MTKSTMTKSAVNKSTVIYNIGELTTNDPENNGRISSAAVVIEGDKVAWVGSSKNAPAADGSIDASGRALLPGWVDSHTHLVFAGDRTSEFEARMAGESYVAGGINYTVESTRNASDAELEANLLRLVNEARAGGTTTIETKTGYGLTVADESRSAEIAAKHVDYVTFLGAHITPSGVDEAEYLDLITGEMLEGVSEYIDSVDVFCEKGAFDEQQTRAVLEAARTKGFAVRLHGNQLGHGPGVQLAVEYEAMSVDHLGFVTEEDIEALASSWQGGKQGTVATVLPACDLSTKMPLAPARKIVDAGAVLAIASNCNPGTSYTTSMGFCVATAVLQMGLTVQEAVSAATLGGAISLGMHEASRSGRGPVGVVTPGAQADLQILEAPSITHLAYRPGVPLTSNVWKNGVKLI